MQFRLGSIPVRVHAPFLVMIAVLASMWNPNPTGLVLVALVMSVSVLAHELGHAIAGRAFGLTPAIDLLAMGGLTSWARGRDISNGRRVIISAAGPVVGLVIAAIAYGVTRAAPPHGIAKIALQATIEVNVYWSIFNLLPMLPLDGGNVTLHALNGLTSGRGEKAARIISLVVATLVAIGALAIRQPWILILAASFAVQNGMVLMNARKLQRDTPLRRDLEKALADLHRGDARGAIVGAEGVAQQAQSPALRLEALRVLAYGLVADGRWSQLMHLLEGGLARAIADDDLARFESAARDSGSRDAGDAIAALRMGRAQPAGDFRAG